VIVPPDAFLTQIGRIAVASAELEARLLNLFALLSSERPPSPSGARHVNPVISTLLGDDSLSQRIDRLRLLALRTSVVDGEKATGAINRVVSDEFASSLAALVRRCESARTTRNDFVHATWEVERDGAIIRTTTRARKLRTDRRTVTIDEVMAAADEVTLACTATLNFHFDVLSGKVHDDWGIMPGLDD
jgi:hypothetical protein